MLEELTYSGTTPTLTQMYLAGADGVRGRYHFDSSGPQYLTYSFSYDPQGSLAQLQSTSNYQSTPHRLLESTFFYDAWGALVQDVKYSSAFEKIAERLAESYDVQTYQVEQFENGLTGGHEYPTYDCAYVFNLGEYADARAAFQHALDTVPNIDTLIYVGHAGITSEGLSELYCGPGNLQELDFGDVSFLDKKNLTESAYIFLDGCDTAATRDSETGVSLKAGTPTIAKAFANHFGTTVYGFNQHVSMGPPQMLTPFYDYDSTWHVRMRFCQPIAVKPN